MPSKTVAWHLAVAINQATGRVVRKASYILFSLRLFKLKLKDKDLKKKLHRKVTKRILKILANPGLA